MYPRRRIERTVQAASNLSFGRVRTIDLKSLSDQRRANERTTPSSRAFEKIGGKKQARVNKYRRSTFVRLGVVGRKKKQQLDDVQKE